MNTLFPLDPGYPEGFQYIPGFISVEEEKELLDAVANVDLHVFNFQGYEAKRKVASFGYDYSFDKKALTKGKEIPVVFQPLLQKLSKQIGIPIEEMAELLVTEYPVGSVINWHRDAPPFDLIAGISLNADCKFKLRPHDKEKQGRGSIITIPVKRRSLYVMQGSSRSEYHHSIAPVKATRYSITIRTLKGVEPRSH